MITFIGFRLGRRNPQKKGRISFEKRRHTGEKQVFVAGFDGALAQLGRRRRGTLTQARDGFASQGCDKTLVQGVNAARTCVNAESAPASPSFF
jgi:hypothetical protein